MNEFKRKLRRLKYRLNHDFFSVENVVLFTAIALCFVWTYQSIKSMSRNWELTERLSKDRKALQLLEIENETAELENEYYKTEEYQEIAARKLANKQLAGEKMVYLEENSEEAKNKHVVAKVVEEKKAYSNPEKWIMFLFPSR